MTRPSEATCQKIRDRGGWWEDFLEGRCRFPIGPLNTWSNVSYPLSGAGLVAIDARPTTWVVAAALCVLGAGSAAYHGIKGPSLIPHSLDWMGMYATMTSEAVLAWAPRAPWLAAGFTGFFALWIGLVMSFRKGMRFDWHMGLLFLVAAVPAFLYGDRVLTALAVGLFLLGFVAWQFDKQRIPIPGLGRKWGHALWHILTGPAIAVLCLARLR